MKPLNLPPCSVRVVERKGKTYIYDPLRRRYVKLTPEEWVRQHFVGFLISTRCYPAARIANEVSITVNSTSKRCDTVVYDNFLTPLAIIEYKSPEVTINGEVFNQISRYNLTLRVPYLLVTNGLTHYCCRMDYETQSCVFLKDIPCYTDLCVT